MSYVRKSVESGRILTQSRLSMVKMGYHNGTDERQADLWSDTDPPF